MNPSAAPPLIPKDRSVERSPSPAAVPVRAVEEALQDFYAALKALPAGKAPGLTLLGALKGVWATARRQAESLNGVSGGRAAGAFQTEVSDLVLRRLLRFAARRAGLREETPGVALLAMGSYGRRELAPYSDLDLLLLHTDPGLAASEERLQSFLSALLRPLWDAGLQLGHAVRTPAECLAMMEDGQAEERALETATSLLEARFVSGDAALAGRFQKDDLGAFFRRRGRPFVEAKLEEALRRYRRRGVSLYCTQPHLKDSPGALRDYQLALWIDRASQLSGHLPRLAERPLVSREVIEEARAGYERILTFRAALHAACGRKQDVLDLPLQAAIAKELGYAPSDEQRASERLLRDYFQAATAVHRLADTVVRRYREEQALANRDLDQLRRRPVDKDFIRIGEHLYLTRKEVFRGSGWLPRAMRAFLIATRLGIGVGQEVRQAIRERLPELDDEARRDPEAARLFRAILRQRAHVVRALRMMRTVGLLGAYLPEFADIQGLVIHDIVHDFTVDEHTLFLQEYLDGLYASGDSQDRLRRNILERLKNPELLRLACLFHDLGKSRGGPGHCKRGALMVPRIGERLGLAQAETRLLIWLVENHLLLSRTSLRRDTGDQKLLSELAEKVRSRERLDALYLLTCADIASVGQGAFTLWKDELLRELYVRLHECLEPEHPAIVREREEEARELELHLLETSPDEAARAEIKKHCALVPPRYLVEVRVEEARLHLDLLKKMRDEKKETVAAVQHRGGLVDVWVVSSDRPKLFSQIAGAFLGLGVNLVSALAYTRRDGLILDQFRVSAASAKPARGGGSEASFWERVCREIEHTLEGQGDIRAKIEAARRRIPYSPAISRRVPPEVRIDNRMSETYTVVDVSCGDRIGLTYGLSRALSDLGCNIHFAMIDVIQGMAYAVYYVSELGGGQVRDPEKRRHLRLLLKAVAEEFQAERR